MRWVLFVAGVALAIWLGLGRSGFVARGGTVPAAATATVYRELDNGRTVTMARGARFAIELESNPSTGFNWDVAERLPDSLDLISQGRSGGSTGDQVGTPDRQRYEFGAKAAGSGDIVLGYRRSGQKGVEPAKTFRLGVVVE
jgi:predicted secreted protein